MRPPNKIRCRQQPPRVAVARFMIPEHDHCSPGFGTAAVPDLGRSARITTETPFMYVTYGYTVPLKAAFIGHDSFSLSKQSMKMTIESIGWRIYKESEMSMTAGPYGLAGRFCQAMLWAPQFNLDIKFDQPEKNLSICSIEFKGPKKTVFDSPEAKAKLFEDVDNLWDKLTHYASARDLQGIRFDCYIRKIDLVSSEQNLFLATIKSSWGGDKQVVCPACFNKIKFSQSDVGRLNECRICKRAYMLREG